MFSEILPRMCDIDDSVSITLFTQGQCRQPLPQHRCIKHCAIPQVGCCLRPKRFWRPVVPTARRLMRRLWIGRGEGNIWHSTYYSIHEGWKGRSVVTVHDMIHERFPDLYKGPNHDQFRADKRRCVQHADAVICVSQTTRQDLYRFYALNSSSVYVVPNAYSDVFQKIEQCNDLAQISTDQPFILYVGSRACYKNFNVLLQAYSRWPQRNKIALVVVGGKPWSDEERRYLARLRIQDRTILHTDADDRTLCYLYNRAVMFVCPSLYEGFGIPQLEAMACGCPIVASRIPSTMEVAGECPIYFDPTSVDGLIRAFDVALSEGRNSERTQMGLKTVVSYSWDKTAAQTLQVYREVCSR